MVPPELQAEVYRTVKLRKSAIDESWGPWTRATGRAMAYVKKLEDPKFDDAEYIAYKDSIADRMERRSTTP